MSAFRTPSNAMADCIQNCTACEHLCLEARAWCEGKGGEYAKPEFLALLALCADICSASARAMQGGSDAYVFLCEACERVCRRCVVEFAKLGERRRLRELRAQLRRPRAGARNRIRGQGAQGVLSRLHQGSTLPSDTICGIEYSGRTTL